MITPKWVLHVFLIAAGFVRVLLFYFADTCTGQTCIPTTFSLCPLFGVSLQWRSRCCLYLDQRQVRFSEGIKLLQQMDQICFLLRPMNRRSTFWLCVNISTSFSCPKSPAEHKSKKMHLFFVYDFFYNQKWLCAIFLSNCRLITSFKCKASFALS